MLPADTSHFQFRTESQDAPSNGSYGTAVTPGASGAEGAWTEIVSDAAVTEDIYAIVLTVNAGNTSAAIKKHLLDVGIDEAGGTSYVAIISNIVCGFSSTLGNSTLHFAFPIRIKAGSAIAVRIEGSNATAGTVRVAIRTWGKASRPECFPVGAYSETIGAIASTGGVAFTPGVSAAEGAWTSLGTTAKDLWWWQIGFQFDDDTMTGAAMHLGLAYGDATNKHLIIENMLIVPNGAEYIQNDIAWNYFDFLHDVPAGSEIWIRGSTSIATNDTGANAVAIGIGG